MRVYFGLCLIFLAAALVSEQNNATNCCTLTIVGDGMDSSEGNIGVLVFNNTKG
jgi:hypothetical protein